MSSTSVAPKTARWRIVLGCVVVVLLVLLVFWALLRPAQLSGPHRRPRVGHERMLGVLAALKDRTATENPYLGDAGLVADRQQLASLPDAATWQRFGLQWSVAHHLLRLGRNREATEQFEMVVQLLPRVRDKMSESEYQNVLFQIAVAWFRRGETENCVHGHTPDSCLLPLKGGGVHTESEPARRAIGYLGQLLEIAPDHTAARWLLNIAWMAVGGYPDQVPESLRIPPSTFEADETFPRFMNVAADLGLNAVNLSGGAVADDFDGDGWLDIATSTWDTAGPLKLYRNNGDGTFTDRTREAGLEGIYGGLNLVQADYDNDGDVDLLVLRGGWLEAAGRQYPNSLLRNNGHGQFTDVTFDAGLGEVHYPTQTAGWADCDNDGDLDLFIGNEGQPGQLFENDGHGRFTDVAAAVGIVVDRVVKGVAWGDVDNDGDPDLYLSIRGGANRLYRNNGNMTFTNIAESAGVTGPRMSFPVWFWDFNNDGNLDLYVASYREGVDQVAADYLGQPHDSEGDCLYIGDGAGGFREAARETGIVRVSQPMGCNYADLDNDGWPDFYLGTGYPDFEGVMPNLLYHNIAGRRFTDVTFAAGLGHLQKGHGVAFADFDHDGDLDIFQQIGGWYPGDAFANALFENPGFDNHWLAVRLVGRESNTSAIGARLRATFVDGGKRRTVFQRVASGGSFGCNPLRRHIGLGAATQVEVLEITWPTTGVTERFSGIAADRLVTITEGEGHEVRVLEPTRFRRRAADVDHRR